MRGKKRNIYFKEARYLLFKAESLNLWQKKLSQRHICLHFIFYALPQIILSGKTTVHKTMAHLWMCATRIFCSSIAIWKEYLVATQIKTNSHMLLFDTSFAASSGALKAAWFSPTKTDCGSFFMLIISWCSVHYSVSAVIPLCTCIQSSVRELSLQSLLILAWKTLCKC